VPRASRIGGKPERGDATSGSELETGLALAEEMSAEEMSAEEMSGEDPGPRTGSRPHVGQRVRSAGTLPLHAGQCCQVSRSTPMRSPRITYGDRPGTAFRSRQVTIAIDFVIETAPRAHA
jgi:hypothetical protein